MRDYIPSNELPKGAYVIEDESFLNVLYTVNFPVAQIEKVRAVAIQYNDRSIVAVWVTESPRPEKSYSNFYALPHYSYLNSGKGKGLVWDNKNPHYQ